MAAKIIYTGCRLYVGICAGVCIRLHTRTPPKQNSGTRRRPLTLVETLLATAIFLILMALLLQVFKGSHRASVAGRNLTNIYANTDITFNVLTNDLRSAQGTSGMSPSQDDDICFHQPDTSQLSFVTVGTPPVEQANSRLLEVVYRFKDHRIERAVNHDASTDDWTYNIYGERPDDLSAIPDSRYATLSRNIIDASFTCLKKGGTEYASPPTQTTELPGALRVQMTVLSRHAFRQWQNAPPEQQERIVQQSARTLSKIILIPGF